MFSTEPRATTSGGADLFLLGDKARGERRGRSTRGIRTRYHRAFRRNMAAVCADELADYLDHGAY